MTLRTALMTMLVAGQAMAIDFADAERLASGLEPDSQILGIDLDDGVFEVEMARPGGTIQVELEFDATSGALLKNETESFSSFEQAEVQRILDASGGILTFAEAVDASGLANIVKIDLEFEDQGLVFDVETAGGASTRVLANRGGSGASGDDSGDDSGGGSSGDDSSGDDSGGGSSGDDSSDDDSHGGGSSGDDSSGDDSHGGGSSGDDSSRDDSHGGGSSGDDSSGDDSSGGGSSDGAGTVSDAQVLDAIVIASTARPDDVAWRVRLDDPGVVRVDVVNPATLVAHRVDVSNGVVIFDQVEVTDEPAELQAIVDRMSGAITFVEALDTARASFPEGDLERLALKIEDGALIYEARFTQGRVRIDATSGGTTRVRQGRWSDVTSNGQLDRRSGDDLRASVRDDGSLFGTYVNADGSVVFVEHDDSGWRTRLFDDGSSASARVLALPADDSGRAFASVSTSDALLLLDSSVDGARDLVAELPGATPITSAQTSFASIDGITFIAGFDASGDAVCYWQTGQLDVDGAELWAFTNLTRDHLEPQGISIPAMSSDLVSYVTPWNGLNIAYLDDAGDVWSIWWSPGMSRWTASNLSDLTGAAPISSGLTAYVMPWGGINIAGLDDSGELVMTWWSPELTDRWASNNLSREFGHPGLRRGELASYVMPWGGQNVAGLDDDGQLVVYWWAPGMNDWV
ncbi:MAG: hypothetical protein KDA28_01475, partial [Phycisphaerales bacterium]|nr:hypothetical protein [Phycisphaerales bacterium]